MLMLQSDPVVVVDARCVVAVKDAPDRIQPACCLVLRQANSVPVFGLSAEVVAEQIRAHIEAEDAAFAKRFTAAAPSCGPFGSDESRADALNFAEQIGQRLAIGMEQGRAKAAEK